MSNLAYPKLNDFLKTAEAVETTPFPQRDISTLMKYLKKIIILNSRVFGHYMARKSALSSFTYSIIPNDKSDQKKAEEALARSSGCINAILDRQLDTVLYGSVLLTLSATSSADGNKIRFENEYSPDEYDYDQNGIYLFRKNSQGIRTKNSGYDIIDPESNNILFDETGYPFRGGLLRSIMPIEILRYDMLLEYGNYLRKLKGLLQIVNKGGSDEDQAAAEQAAANAIKENFFISSEAIELKLNQVTGSAQNTFKDFLEWIDNSIAIAFLGNANTSDLPKYAGSRAALQVQKLISADIFYSDMNRVEKLMDKLLLIDWRINYNPSAALSDLPYKFQFNLSEEQDFEANSNALRNIIDFVPLKQSEVYQKIGFTPPEPGDVIFKGFTTQNNTGN